MPPAVIPIIAAVAAAGAGAITSNVQQKAALKNNETQQQAALNNANSAWTKAITNTQAYQKANPAPTPTGVSGPVAGSYGQGGVTPQPQAGQPSPINAASLMQKAGVSGTPSSNQIPMSAPNPGANLIGGSSGTSPYVAQILAALRQGGAPNV